MIHKRLDKQYEESAVDSRVPSDPRLTAIRHDSRRFSFILVNRVIISVNPTDAVLTRLSRYFATFACIGMYSIGLCVARLFYLHACLLLFESSLYRKIQ